MAHLPFSHFFFTNYTDICFMSLFFQAWFCPFCGYELCALCYQDLPAAAEDHPPGGCTGRHHGGSLWPVTFFSLTDLHNTLKSMESVMLMSRPFELGLLPASRSPLSQPTCSGERGAMVELPRYSLQELTQEMFTQKWNKCEPFVLTGVIDPTTPAQLLDLPKQGNRKCTTMFFDGEVWQTSDSTLSTYFGSWNQTQLSKRSLQIRVRTLAYSL